MIEDLKTALRRFYDVLTQLRQAINLLYSEIRDTTTI